MLTTIRWSVGSGLILLAIVLGASLFADAKTVAEPGETSLGFSITRLKRHLVEPALERAIENIEANREKVPTELALPSGLPEGSPHTTPQAAQPPGMTTQEEIDFLVHVFALKYGVDPSTLREVARCESTDNPWANGKEGERGLTQFLKSTWEDTPLEVFGWDAAYHPAVNLEAAAWMLAEGRIGEFHAIPCR